VQASRSPDELFGHDLPLNGLLGLLLFAALALAGAARAQDQAGKTSGAAAKTATPANDSAAKIQKNVRKLSTIILPKLDFRETAARDALASLEKMSAEFDPQKIGVKIKIDASSAKAAANPVAGLPADRFETPITVSLSNIPLGEALRYVTSLAVLDFKVEDFGIVIGPWVPPALVTKEWKVQPATLRLIGYQAGGDLNEFLQGLGISFPEGAKAAMNANQDRLVVTDTEKNLSRISFWLDPNAVFPPGDPVASSPPDDERKLQEARRVVEKKLARIIIPHLEFRDATIREAVGYLMKKSMELDTEHRGTSIVLRIDSELLSPGMISPDDAKITLSLTNVPLDKAFTEVASRAGLVWSVENYAISIRPLADRVSVLSTREWKLAPGTLAKLGLAADGDPKAFLTAKGIAFPPGASVTVHPNQRFLVMKNTEVNFDLFDSLLYPDESHPPAPRAAKP
jgi:hypothetical protein